MNTKFWIEKTIVDGRLDRISGDRALGKALWSPMESQAGGDIYKNMRLVSKDDIVIHLINNKSIVGISKVKESAKETTGLGGTAWNTPSYLIELKNYTELNPPIDRNQILNNQNKELLIGIANHSEVFYNRNNDLRQGAYLTPCPVELLNLINNIYHSQTKYDLPLLDLSIFNELKEMAKGFESQSFHKKLNDIGLNFSENIVSRFLASLCTKPFVILTGLSGSGKTKLAQAFAMWICADKNQYCILPVGADWTNREPLLGFPNALEPENYVKPDNEVLDLIIKANKNESKPYFLILDEMNLSHVERYFADFLSVMESNTEIALHSGKDEWNGVPAKIGFPKNLFIIGTVNIDETTYMFSPKVLDRASVIEFRVTAAEMERYLGSNSQINLKNLEGEGKNMAESFVELAKDESLEAGDKKELNKTLMNFFAELKKTGAEFGYRSASEIIRFAAVAKKLDKSWEQNEITDAAIMQKLLPKVHGSRRKLEPVLKTLAELCLKDVKDFETVLKSQDENIYTEKSGFPISFEKICRMYNNLLANGFTSYAEA